MKIEFVGIGAVHGFKHEKSSDLKKLAKEITKETGVAADIRGDNLIVSGSSIPAGSAVVISNGGVRTLSIEAFDSQYRELVDYDVSDLEKKVDALEKKVADMAKPVATKAEVAKEQDAKVAAAVEKAEAKAKPKAEVMVETDK